MEKRYFSASDAQMRWHNSVVKFEEDFFYAVSSSNMNTRLTLYSLDGMILWGEVDSNDERLDIRSPELGYVNHDQLNIAMFVFRVPLRRQKQGINEENCFYSIFSREPRMLELKYIQSNCFLQMLKGVYPSFEETKNLLINSSNSIQSRAFSRDFALWKEKDSSIKLLKRDTEIAAFSKESGRFELLPDYNNSIIIMELAGRGVPL